VWEGGRVTGYGLELDAVEHARLRAQAAGVHRLDEDLWPLAGVVAGADVVDLGCGPAAVMLELLALVGPGGRLTGVDADPGMVERGRAEAAAIGARNVVVRQGLAQDSGLPAASFDAAVVRLVLIHNGGREQEIVDHAASLVRPGGRVMLYDLDSTMIRIVPPTAPISELHERYQAYQRARGNDPAVGLRLPELLESAGLTVEAFRGTCSIRSRAPGQRGPSWAARRAMVQTGVATSEDLERWASEFDSLDAQPRQPWMIGCGFVAIGRRAS
jgi:ubiquinone/menaquinone biosynthesis C-methylase UbiE